MTEIVEWANENHSARGSGLILDMESIDCETQDEFTLEEEMNKAKAVFWRIAADCSSRDVILKEKGRAVFSSEEHEE